MTPQFQIKYIDWCRSQRDRVQEGLKRAADGTTAVSVSDPSISRLDRLIAKMESELV